MTDEPVTLNHIGIVEDDLETRLYLEQVIGEADGLAVAFSEGSLAGAMRRAADGPLDLCLVDLKLPDGSGVDFVRRIKASRETRCLILTVLGDRTSVLVALQAGADGYLLKDASPLPLVENIRGALRGETPISPQAARFLLEIYKAALPGLAQDAGETGLTAREVEVLRLFSRGLSYREAASALAISPHTVRDHVKAIYRKLAVHSRSEAVFEARQLGVISPLD